MKKLLFVLFAVILFACENPPQTVNVKVTYTIPAGCDSSYIVFWKGTDTNQNPLFEDGDWNAINKTGLLIQKIAPASGNYTQQFNADGQTFKVAIVNFISVVPSDLTVSAFYILPTKPAKASIINVQIF